MHGGKEIRFTCSSIKECMKKNHTISSFIGIVLIVLICAVEVMSRPVKGGHIIKDITCRPVTVISLVLLLAIGGWAYKTRHPIVWELSLIILFSILFSL